MRNMSTTIDHLAGTITLGKACKVTGELYSVTVDQPKYVRWLGGTRPIQDIFPELNADQREFLISGCTPAEWTELFWREAWDNKVKF